MSFSVRLDALKLTICIGDTSRCVEARGVGRIHGGASVGIGGCSSVSGPIQRLEVSD